MSLLFRAGTAFLLVALITGHVQAPSPRWRAVATDLDRAQPEGRLKAQALWLFHGGRG
jgi:hypothetical protein